MKMVHKYQNKEDSRKGASLSVGALLEEPGVGAHLLGIWRDMGRRAQGMGITLLGVLLGSQGLIYKGPEQQALETGISLHRVPFEGVCSPGTLRDS